MKKEELLPLKMFPFTLTLAGLSYQDLDDMIENDPSVIVCWK